MSELSRDSLESAEEGAQAGERSKHGHERDGMSDKDLTGIDLHNH